MPRYEIQIIYLLCIIAIGSWIVVWMFVEWQQIILGVMLLLGFGLHNELPWFLHFLEPLVKLFAIVFLLMIIHMAYYIEEYAKNIFEDSNNA